MINHSYLAEQMKAAMKGGKDMPEEVKELMRAVKVHAGAERMDYHQVVAPIP